MLTVFFQMLALLIMIGTGFFVGKKRMMDEHTNHQMSQMIVNIFNPLLIVASAENAVGTIDKNTMLIVAGIAAGMFAVFIFVAKVFSPFFDKDPMQQKLFQMMFIFSNLGFIGIPVVSSILGSEHVVYVTEFMLVYNLVFYTYGIALMNGEFSLTSLKELANPGTVFSVAAMLIIVFDLTIPAFLQTAIMYLGNVASPMALVLVGYTLSCSNLKHIFGQPKLYLFALIKLLILPLILFPLLHLVTKNSDLLSVSIIMFGMPIGNMPLILGNEKGIDVSTCSAAIILTTILCVVTVPVLLSVAE